MRTSKLLYADETWRRTMHLSDVKMVPEYKYAKYDTTQIMLERTIHLAIILLLVKCRCQSHWSNDKFNAKVWIVN